MPIDAGSVSVAGRSLAKGGPAARIRAGVALLSEDRKVEGVIPEMSVRDNIALAALPQLSRGGFVSRRKQDDIVATFIKRLSIKASGPDQLLRELSGGNQQKVLLARWLATAPQLLILDEPTRGIDIGAKAEIQRLVAGLAEDGLGVIFISSELDEVLRLSHRVVVMRDRRKIAELENTADLGVDDIVTLIAKEGAA
jgi:monosaccharide-transporting ATPase